MERLKLLKLMTLEKRRLLADLSFCFKLLNGFADSPLRLRHLLLVQDYPGTRGHNFKLRCNKFSTDIAKYSFCNRIVKPWHALPNEIVNPNIVSRFNALTLYVNCWGQVVYGCWPKDLEPTSTSGHIRSNH